LLNRPEWGWPVTRLHRLALKKPGPGAEQAQFSAFDASNDAGASTLTLLMTAPMLVTHWINWRYRDRHNDPTVLAARQQVLRNGGWQHWRV
jgi:uncharacterized protein YbcC (UPF0753/DUF2309 family)